MGLYRNALAEATKGIKENADLLNYINRVLRNVVINIDNGYSMKQVAIEFVKTANVPDSEKELIKQSALITIKQMQIWVKKEAAKNVKELTPVVISVIKAAMDVLAEDEKQILSVIRNEANNVLLALGHNVADEKSVESDLSEKISKLLSGL